MARAHVKFAVVGFLSVSAIVFALSLYEWRRRKGKNRGSFLGNGTVYSLCVYTLYMKTRVLANNCYIRKIEIGI